ncbi:chloride channel protein [Bombilactobacillus bombi]|uniref:chloride channel protein n=1 Tax=Bombilactobacillus bombi TaxID=1303590 RepID=UPI0038F81FB8
MHSRLQIIHVQFIIKSVCVGLIVGIVVSCFRWSIEKSLSFWQLLYRQASINPTLILIILIANLGIGLFIGYLSQSQPHIMGSGIPEVEGQINNQLQLAWWLIFWRKFVAGTLAIGSGLFLGREGPSIQLGATLGQGLGEYFEDNLPNQKVIFAAGAAAGLAAAFNAPLAGNFLFRLFLS